jgi:hypothetical protein
LPDHSGRTACAAKAPSAAVFAIATVSAVAEQHRLAAGPAVAGFVGKPCVRALAASAAVTEQPGIATDSSPTASRHFAAAPGATRPAGAKQAGAGPPAPPLPP